MSAVTLAILSKKCVGHPWGSHWTCRPERANFAGIALTNARMPRSFSYPGLSPFFNRLYRMRIWLAILAAFLVRDLHAQIPLEIFAAKEKTSFDVMFFKYFRDRSGESGRFLFFHRTRALVDYGQESRGIDPLFGFTGAFSYNAPAWKGFAPVAVVQVVNAGGTAKVGVQYVSIRQRLTLFTWSIAEVAPGSGIDLYLLLRGTPKISENLDLFLQLELVNNLPLQATDPFQLTQRGRIGIKRGRWQAGVGADVIEYGRGSLGVTVRPGIFGRYEFS